MTLDNKHMQKVRNVGLLCGVNGQKISTLVSLSKCKWHQFCLALYCAM